MNIILISICFSSKFTILMIINNMFYIFIIKIKININYLKIMFKLELFNLNILLILIIIQFIIHQRIYYLNYIIFNVKLKKNLLRKI